MTPVIRVDDEVWAWLQSHAKPLEDTPNSVLRRLAHLERPSAEPNVRPTERAPDASRVGLRQNRQPVGRRGARTNHGRNLNEQWKVGARHALYHKEGNYYNHLRYFPGALFDPQGYVVFKTEAEYLKSPHLQHGTQLHVPGGIASLSNYVRADR